MIDDSTLLQLIELSHYKNYDEIIAEYRNRKEIRLSENIDDYLNILFSNHVNSNIEKYTHINASYIFKAYIRLLICFDILINDHNKKIDFVKLECQKLYKSKTIQRNFFLKLVVVKLEFLYYFKLNDAENARTILENEIRLIKKEKLSKKIESLFINNHRLRYAEYYCMAMDYNNAYKVFKLVKINLLKDNLRISYLSNFALINEILGNYTDAIKMYQYGIDYFENKNFSSIGMFYNNIFIAYIRANLFKEGIKEYIKTKDRIEKLSDLYKSNILVIVSVLFLRIGRYQEVIDLSHFFNQKLFFRNTFSYYYEVKLFLTLGETNYKKINSILAAQNQFFEENERMLLNNLINISDKQNKPILDFQKMEIENLNLNNKILKQKFETKDTLLSQLSHEIRTPLSIILGNTEKLLSKKISADIQNKIKTIRSSSLQLISQIDSILEYNRLEINLQKNNLQPCKIIELIRKTAINFSIIAEEKSISMYLKSNISEAEIDIDIDKIQKIINNLISNAIRYNVENGSINIDIYLSKQLLTLVISDTGIGISEEHLPKIFDRYYQVKNEKKAEGFGVGLSVVNMLVKAMKGKINVTSKLNRFTNFKVEIPITSHNVINPLPFSIEVLKMTPSISRVESFDGLKPTLLIVDDNVELRKFIRSTFQKTYNCIEANDGEEGYKILIEKQPDIILSDYSMPLMNGIELLEKMRANPNTNHIAFVMLTADNMDKTKMNAIEKGADLYINKPFNINELSNIFKNIIKRQAYIRNKFRNNLDTKNPESKLLSKNEKFIDNLNSILAVKYHVGDFGLNELSALMYVSKATLIRKTKSILKENPSQIILNYRLKKAKELLENNVHSVSETAYECGFSTPQYFTRVFKQKYGINPRDIIGR